MLFAHRNSRQNPATSRPTAVTALMTLFDPSTRFGTTRVEGLSAEPLCNFGGHEGCLRARDKRVRTWATEAIVQAIAAVKLVITAFAIEHVVIETTI